MMVVSYDISDGLLRSRFSRMLTKNGAVRLQYSVYEIRNTKRVMDNIKTKIDAYFLPKFTGADSIMLFSVDDDTVVKYGNAIHRDQSLIIL